MLCKGAGSGTVETDPFMKNFYRILPFLAAVALWPEAGHAYMGPGAGLGAIGTLLALIGAVLLAVVGFVWYPVKRLIRSRRSRGKTKTPGE